jgi:hypothetical protein
MMHDVNINISFKPPIIPVRDNDTGGVPSSNGVYVPFCTREAGNSIPRAMLCTGLLGFDIYAQATNWSPCVMGLWWMV